MFLMAKVASNLDRPYTRRTLLAYGQTLREHVATTHLWARLDKLIWL